MAVYIVKKANGISFSWAVATECICELRHSMCVVLPVGVLDDVLSRHGCKQRKYSGHKLPKTSCWLSAKKNLFYVFDVRFQLNKIWFHLALQLPHLYFASALHGENELVSPVYFADILLRGLHSIRTDDWRYTEWVAWDGAKLHPIWDTVNATELYDHRGCTEEPGCNADFDRWENENVAGTQPAVEATLSRQLRAHYAV